MLARLLLQATNNLLLRLVPHLLLVFLACSMACAGGGPRNVLVVRNLDSAESRQIANYYVSARHIPPQNICDIHASTSEIVSHAVCENEIVAPIRNFLRKPELAGLIDYIVITKGIPLGADYGYCSGNLSVTSILTCVGEPNIKQYLRNPYSPNALAPIETAFSHQLRFSDPFLQVCSFRLYLVTRLDGYTVSDVLRAIDGSLTAAKDGAFLIDRQVIPDSTRGGYPVLNDRLSTANDILISKGLPTIYDDTCAFVGGCSNLMGYFSFGSNDPQFSAASFRSNSFAPGSIADTYVSNSACTFEPGFSDQSLIADLIAKGACGVSGYVSEPATAFSTYADVLFDEYTKGYNMAESFYMACPELYWKSAVVGDPLMAAFAVKPKVSLLMGQEPLTGDAATVTATATHRKGVSSVDFYFDDWLAGTSCKPPYSIVIDTTKYVVGRHTIEAVAYENSPVATQGSASATVEVSNRYSMLGYIADAYHSPDGQGVKVMGKVVTAGSLEMGGTEFYIEEPTRAAGMRVLSTFPVNEGDVVAVTGDLSTESGERTIIASNICVTQQSPTPLKPLFMKTSAIGGGDCGPNTRGVTGGVGVRSVGLLVCVAGRVTYVGKSDEPFFYIDDGCRLSDGSGHTGLRIACMTTKKPNFGSYVSITGVGSCTRIGDNIVGLVKARHIVVTNTSP